MLRQDQDNDDSSKYLLTASVIDDTFANPFWHFFLVLSKVTKNKKIEVMDNYGYYGLPSTVRDSFLSKLKIKSGLDVDLDGNHGMLRHEDLRFLDLGEALHGTTFELTKEDFDRLQKRCLKMVDKQEAAINDAVKALHLEPSKEYRIYPYEKHSRAIFNFEIEKAKKESRKPRLNPFNFNFEMTLFGPSARKSYTCKSQGIALLQGILSPNQIDILTENGKHPTVPKYMGHREPIYWHSTGPLREHKKKSGDIVYYRDFADEGVKLHWTLPPQKIETLNNETILLLSRHPEYHETAKTIISQLQRLEWLFINAVLPEQYKPYQKELIQTLCDTYQAFSIITEPNTKTSMNKLTTYLFSLVSLSTNPDEKMFIEAIKKGKSLINNLYMAIVDNWKIDDNHPLETAQPTIEDENKEEGNLTNPLEAIASYLNVNDKKRVCKIIQRNYLEPEVEPESEIKSAYQY